MISKLAGGRTSLFSRGMKHMAQLGPLGRSRNFCCLYTKIKGAGSPCASSRIDQAVDRMQSFRHKIPALPFSSGPTLSSSNRLERFILPDIGEGIKEVTIKEWRVKVGDMVSEFDPICEVESDKATATISSRFDGKIVKICYDLGDMAQVGEPLVEIEINSAALITSAAGDSSQETKTPRVAEPQMVVAAATATDSYRSKDETDGAIVATLPSVRRLARENGVDLSKVKPSGRFNRILKEDVLRYVEDQQQKQLGSGGAADGAAQGQQLADLLSFEDEQKTKAVPFGGIQRAMFKTMTTSLTVPHFNYADEIDLTRLQGYLSERKSKQGSSPSSFALFVKMVSLALLEYPQLNASIGADNEHLVHKHYHNIGIAVDTKRGLIVPNVKNVQSKTVNQVNEDILRLRELAYNSKLSPQDLSGGTISLSNIGAVGGIFGVPVVVVPEIVIGALGRSRQLPRFDNQGRLEARHIMQVVWSADHRVVDGATLSRFSNLLKGLLEQPELALDKMR